MHIGCVWNAIWSGNTKYLRSLCAIRLRLRIIIYYFDYIFYYDLISIIDEVTLNLLRIHLNLMLYAFIFHFYFPVGNQQGSIGAQYFVCLCSITWIVMLNPPNLPQLSQI